MAKKDIHGDINDMYKVITGRLLEAQGYYSEEESQRKYWNKKKEHY